MKSLYDVKGIPLKKDDVVLCMKKVLILVHVKDELKLPEELLDSQKFKIVANVKEIPSLIKTKS